MDRRAAVASPRPGRDEAAARYVVFRCYDPMQDDPFSAPFLYYESIDLIDARHSQTILAYGLNGQTLPIANGAPLRVRIEQRLGYMRDAESRAPMTPVRPFSDYDRKLLPADDMTPLKQRRSCRRAYIGITPVLRTHNGRATECTKVLGEGCSAIRQP
jgi:hypothetical protein